jgi:hypothetical protein
MKRIEEFKTDLQRLFEEISLKDLLENDTLLAFIEDIEELVEVGSLSKIINWGENL